MTHGSLLREIPVLEPDDELLDRLTALAAASRVSRGVVVPVAFGGPASRAVVMAATVAAVTAGAAAAATHLSQTRHEQPAPPRISVSIQRPGAMNDHAPATTTEDAGVPVHPAALEPSAHTAAGTDQHAPVVQHSTADDPAPPVPTGHQSGDQSGDQTDDQTGDQSGDQSGDDSGTGDGAGGDGDTGDDVAGVTTSGTSDGGSQDGGGTQAGSGDGSGAGSGRDPSSVLDGPSD